MRVVFVQNDFFVRVGITTLAGVLPGRGHEAAVVVEPLERDPLGALRKLRPDLLAFYATTTMVPWVLDFAARAKRSLGVPVVVGGPHTTFAPDLALHPSVDFVCRGEGEGALLDLLEGLERRGDPSGIPNLALREEGGLRVNPLRPYVNPLDDLPDPDFSPYARYRVIRDYYREAYPILAGRGCPYDCVFCFVPAYRALYSGQGKYIRWRAHDRIVGEMREARERYGVRRFVFEDDTFILNPRWLRAFGAYYADHLAAPFLCQTTAVSLDEDTVEVLRRMGCTGVRFGLESGNEEMRMKVLRKEVSNEDIARAGRLLKRAGMNFQTFNILGLPGETLEQALETYRLNRRIGTSFAWTSILTSYPGTDALTPLLGGAPSEPFAATLHLPSRSVDRDVLHLQKLLQLFLLLRLPERAVRWIVRRPWTGFFHLLYRAVHAISVQRLTRVPWAPFLRMAFVSRRFMNARIPSGEAHLLTPLPAGPLKADASGGR